MVKMKILMLLSNPFMVGYQVYKNLWFVERGQKSAISYTFE